MFHRNSFGGVMKWFLAPGSWFLVLAGTVCNHTENAFQTNTGKAFCDIVKRFYFYPILSCRILSIPLLRLEY
jgi:hypothetical protein